MREYLPLLIVGAIIGVFSAGFIVAFVTMKDKKEAIEDVMKDALEGGVGIDAVTKSVDKVLEGKKK